MIAKNIPNPNLEKAQAKRRAMIERGETPVRLDPAERARANPTSLRAAVTAKCWDCEGADEDPCWQWRVGNCQIRDCPLWPHRPHQKFEGREMPASLRAAL